MKNTERFSDRVSDYVAYRPSYPLELINTLVERCDLNSNSLIADIGSGTGKLTELLLRRNYTVFGVEPNDEMRTAAESLLHYYQSFRSISGESDNTWLDDESIDLLTAAQSFHWFEPTSTRKEFERILKPNGYIALIWNQRDVLSPFQQHYDQLLSTHCPEYGHLNHRNVSDDNIAAFTAPHSPIKYTFRYKQTFDLESFIGRMCSSSYTPSKGTAEHHRLVDAAKHLHRKFQTAGFVEFTYLTHLYLTKMP